MKKLLVLVVFGCITTSLAHGSSLAKDVSPSHSKYSAIKNAVQKHYITLDASKKFNPKSSFTREDAAVLANKLDAAISKNSLGLKRSEIEELVSLSKSFKTYLVENEETQKDMQAKLDRYKQLVDQSINDVSALNNEYKTQIESIKKEHSDHVMYLTIGIIAAAIVGVL